MSLPPIDAPVALRSANLVPAEPLRAYLHSRLPLGDAPLEILQFPGGFSNLTYLIRIGDRDVVLRRPPPGVSGKGAHDMLREHRLLERLAPCFDKAPRPLLACEDVSIIGAPFYLMERVTGVILRAKPPAGTELDAATMQRLSRSTAETLAAIHAIDYVACGLGDLGKPEGYVQRQVDGWRTRYARAQTDEIADLDQLGLWLEQQRPPESGAALVHNDFKYDNLVLDRADLGRITAVLDWEMATIGDPLLDLGSTLAYWADRDDPDWWRQHAMSLTTLDGNLDRAGFVDAYSQASGREVSNAVFYYAYGLLKLAAIIQQIYARYRQGTTQDPRFAALGDVVRACGRIGARAIDRGRISGLG